MASTYTVYGNEALDRRIDRDMTVIAETVARIIPAPHLAAVILGGGYGRGEGGVEILADTEMKLFNDYDLFVITRKLSRSAQKRYSTDLRQTSVHLSETMGLEVDFGPLKNVSELPKLPPTMMWFELKHGHRVIFGPADILNAVPDFDGNRLPPDNAMQLMLNRGVGLLLSREKLAKSLDAAEDQEFVTRNIFKAVMACGDAFLMLYGRFDSSYCRRRSLLAEFQGARELQDTELLPLYEQAIDYKLQPTHHRNKAELQELYERMLPVFRYFYSFVLSAVYDIPRDFGYEWDFYLAMRNWHDQAGVKTRAKNILLNLYYVGPQFSPWFLFVRYPRFRLYLALPQLLLVNHLPEPWEYEVLGLNEPEPDVLYKRFMTLWQRFN